MKTASLRPGAVALAALAMCSAPHRCFCGTAAQGPEEPASPLLHPDFQGFADDLCYWALVAIPVPCITPWLLQLSSKHCGCRAQSVLGAPQLSGCEGTEGVVTLVPLPSQGTQATRTVTSPGSAPVPSLVEFPVWTTGENTAERLAGGGHSTHEGHGAALNFHSYVHCSPSPVASGSLPPAARPVQG